MKHTHTHTPITDKVGLFLQILYSFTNPIKTPLSAKEVMLQYSSL